MKMTNWHWQYKGAGLWKSGKHYINMSMRARNHVHLRWVHVKRASVISSYVDLTYTGHTNEDLRRWNERRLESEYPF